MTVPHYINEDKSDMRGIKSGWYAVEDDGNLSSGPFSSLEACVARIAQPTNGTTEPIVNGHGGVSLALPKMEAQLTVPRTVGWVTPRRR
jgi:hypothetical protein